MRIRLVISSSSHPVLMKALSEIPVTGWKGQIKILASMQLTLRGAMITGGEVREESWMGGGENRERLDIRISPEGYPELYQSLVNIKSPRGRAEHLLFLATSTVMQLGSAHRISTAQESVPSVEGDASEEGISLVEDFAEEMIGQFIS